MNGSLIFVFPTKSSSILDKLISLWEGGEDRPFHVGVISTNSRGEHVVLQADPDGNFCVPLSYYDQNPTRIIPIPGWLSFDHAETYNFFSNLDYSYEGAAEAGLAQYFRWIPFIKTKRWYCSEAAAYVWQEGGYPFPTIQLDPFRLLQIVTNRITSYPTKA